MEYQTFRGADVQEALSSVRQALGADALIESTRHVQNGQGGALGRTFVEIIAAPSLARKPSGRAAAIPVDTRRSRAYAAPERGGGKQEPPAKSTSPSQRPLEETAVGRELLQLRLMLDELGQGRTPKDRTRAMLTAAGFEGTLARTLAAGGGKPPRGPSRELCAWLRERVREKLACRTGLIEEPGRRMIACVG